MVKGFDLVSMGVGRRRTGQDSGRFRDRRGGPGHRRRQLRAALQRLHAREERPPQATTLSRDRIAELGKTVGEELLTPTRIYVKPVLEALDRFEVHGIGHITGGSFSKLERLVGETADSDSSLKIPPPPADFQHDTAGGRPVSKATCRGRSTWDRALRLRTSRPRSKGLVKVFGRSGIPGLGHRRSRRTKKGVRAVWKRSVLPRLAGLSTRPSP